MKHKIMTNQYRIGGLLTALSLVLLLSGPALAHKVMVFGWVEDGQVKTISKFSGGKKVRGGRIRVFNDKDKLILEGVTDDNGEFDFGIPGKTGLKIELEAAMGHKNISIIPADQFGGPAEPAVVENPAQTEIKQTQAEPAPVSVDVEAQVARVIDRKVMPLLHSLVEREEKPKVSDVLGGIGYIVGLFGLFLYMRSRNKD